MLGDFARSLELTNGKEWFHFAQTEGLPDDIPVGVESFYKGKGWLSWGDWLGTGIVAYRLRVYLTYEKAKKFARSLKLSSAKQWMVFKDSNELPSDIPLAPQLFYKDKGWVSWGDWLGTGTVAPYLIQFRNFHDARKFVRSLKLKNGDEWRVFSKSEKFPSDIPANPLTVYKNEGWKGMGDWLGTGRIANFNKKYRNFEEARHFARSLKLTTTSEWKIFSRSERLPSDIPIVPSQTYKNKGWKGMGDWLGTGRIACHLRKYRTFNEARKFVRSLNLKSGSEWRAFCKSGKLPADIPAAPRHTYKDKG